MAKKKDKIILEEYKNFIADHPEQLIMVFNPASDDILASYAGKYTFVRFEDEKHVVLRALSPDMFELAIDEFMAGVINTLGIDEQKNVQLVKAVGGSVKAIGEALQDNQKEDAKESKKGGSKGTSKGGDKKGEKDGRKVKRGTKKGSKRV